MNYCCKEINNVLFVVFCKDAVLLILVSKKSLNRVVTHISVLCLL